MSSCDEPPDLPFQAVAQHLPILCWISDAEGVITWVNDAWLAYTGKGPEALAGEGLASLHDPAVLPEVRRHWAEAKAAGAPVEMVFPLKGTDGVLRPFLTRVSPLRDHEGRITRWFGTNTDISDHAAAEDRAKVSEARLQENLTRLRLATQAGGIGVWEWRLATNEMIYSPQAKAICGFAADEPVTYEMVVAATHPEDLPRTLPQAQRALDPAIRERSTYEYRIVRPSGEVRWVIASGEAVFETTPEGERATRYVGTLIDITEDRQVRQQLQESEARLRESEERLRLATDAAEIGLWDVDPVSDTLFWPARVKAMFGISAEAPVSLSEDFFPCLHPEDRDRVAEAYWAATDPMRRALYDVEYRTIGKEDGVIRSVAAKGRGLFDEKGECYRVIGVAMDITARKDAERKLLEQTQSLSVLNTTGAALAAELDLEKIVQLVTDAGVEITGAEVGAFFYNQVNEAGEHYTLYTLSGMDRSKFEAFPMPRNTHVFGPTFAGEGVVRASDITKDARYGQNPPYAGMPDGHVPIKSYLAVPVVSRSGGVLGGLFFGHSQPGVFSDAAEQLVRGVAGQAAVAIDNARLYQDAQREITQRRRSEQRQRLLINELNHRVKNTLATVQSIVAQTARAERSLKDVRTSIEGRLMALSAAHDLLTRHSWEGADLCEIVERAAQPFNLDGTRIQLSGPKVPLLPQQALAISMAIHELATNAAKYGALSAPGGRASIDWRIQDGQLQLVWVEEGGPPVLSPTNKGFGSRLLERGLAADLNGQVHVEYRPEGVKCTVTAPVASDVAREPLLSWGGEAASP